MSKFDKLIENAEPVCLILAAVFFLLWLILAIIGFIINL